MYISENNRLCSLHCFPCQVLLSAYWAHVPCPYQHSHSLELCSTCPLFTIRFPRATVPASLGKTGPSPCEPVSRDAARYCRRLGVPLPPLLEVRHFLGERAFVEVLDQLLVEFVEWRSAPHQDVAAGALMTLCPLVVPTDRSVPLGESKFVG